MRTFKPFGGGRASPQRQEDCLVERGKKSTQPRELVKDGNNISILDT